MTARAVELIPAQYHTLNSQDDVRRATRLRFDADAEISGRTAIDIFAEVRRHVLRIQLTMRRSDLDDRPT